jgi:serine/threonine protein kinase
VTISSGSKFGPYEVISPLGAGGMGEVYRARDPRLGRDVAIKVLPATFSKEADRLRRFEQESSPGPPSHRAVDIVTGRKELWRELMPADASGVVDVPSVCPTPDGKSYVYSYARILSSLFLVEGVK